MVMMEVIYYHRFEAGFEVFPAENYVDYMTNVMPVPERHYFYIPRRGMAIICEVKDVEGKRVLMWSLRKYDTLPTNTIEILIYIVQVEEMMAFLDDLGSPFICDMCEKNLGDKLRFF
jgi:hypothetical protein